MSYKRLTNNNLEEYNPELDFCAGCKYYGEPNGCNRPNGTCGNYERFIETYNCLAELEDKIENGTLIELPCKENQEIYVISNKRIITTYARTFNYLGKELGMEIQTTRYEKGEDGWLKLKTKIIHENEFGKSVFLTKAEAEKKLKQ